MLFSNLLTYGRRKNVRRIAAALLMLFIILMPVQNVLTTSTVSVAHAQTQTATPTFCDAASTCLTSIVYLFAVYIPTNFAYAAAYLFNGGLQLALNSGAYALNFLSTGWTVVRDIANLTFIFILIYIAYIVIMRAETSGTMKMLAWVVAMALLINFSFFITRMVIDAGNILSVQFYNAIDIPNSIPSPLNTKSCPPDCIKDLTGGIMDAVKVQGILGDKSFDAFIKNGDNGVGKFATNVLVQTLVFVSVGIFMSLLGFIFLIVGIKFIVRVVVLWLTIIASPLAFAAHALPSNKKVMGYYQMWQDNLIQSTFYPAVFLFLFFIMTIFLKTLAGSGGLVPDIFAALAEISKPDVSSAQAGISIIANIGIRMGLVIVLLYFAMKASDAFSSMGSGMANSIVRWTGGAVSGVASRATRAGIATSAWTGRNTAGRLANVASRSAVIQNFAAKSIWGRPVKAGLEGIAKGSYDVRHVPGLNAAAGLINNSASGKALGLKVDLGKAGTDNIRKQFDRRAKNVEERGKELAHDAVDTQKAMPGSMAILRDEETKLRTMRAHTKAEQLEAQKIKDENDKSAKDPKNAGIKGYAQKSAEYGKRLAELKTQSDKLEKEAALNQKRLTDDKELRKYTDTRLKGLDKERKERLAQRLESDYYGNLYLGPSNGTIKGVSKMRTGKSAHDELIEAAEKVRKEHAEEEGHGEDGHGHTTTPATTPTPAATTAAATPKAAPAQADPHNPHPMTFKGVRGAIKHYGSNEAAGDEIMEKIKRLDLRMQNVQHTTAKQSGQMGDVQQSLSTLGKTVQRQQSSASSGPTSFGKNDAGKGAMRPTTNTTVVGSADKEKARQMPSDRGREGVQGRVNELSESIVNERAQTPETPPSDDSSNPPKTA